MPSKLEMYIDILNVLEQKGPLRASHIMDEANLSRSILNGSLSFLLKQGLVEEQASESSVVYVNTARGSAVIKFFNDLAKALPVKDEDGEILRVSY